MDRGYQKGVLCVWVAVYNGRKVLSASPDAAGEDTAVIWLQSMLEYQISIPAGVDLQLSCHLLPVCHEEDYRVLQ
jgi:hypothetical protein